MRQIIKSVADGSIGQELGLEPGDSLLAIDGQDINDVLDYFYLCEKEEIHLKILTKDGETVECDVEKDEDEPLGLTFEEDFMGQYRHCLNKCMFCFIDQLPKGMRSTLYFKDDDSRLSFLDGSYITMTNMKEEDFQKIIDYRMSPINVSIHTTDPKLRVMMLKNKNAVDLLPRMEELKKADIRMNGQIVLCKNINDGKNLDRTITDLMAFRPQLQSVSIVPCGLTKYREGLYPLELFTSEDCARVIDQVEPYQKRCFEESGMHFIHLSDEFYINAKRPLPEAERYDGYLQLENGVGMMRLFIDEAKEAMDRLDPASDPHEHISVVTAVSAGPYIRQIAQDIMKIYPHLKVDVHIIINHFFGENITVTGLLTATDIVDQLKGENLGERLLLPENLLRAGTTTLLDDKTVVDIEQALQTPTNIVKSSGISFVRTVVGQSGPEDQ